VPKHQAKLTHFFMLSLQVQYTSAAGAAAAAADPVAAAAAAAAAEAAGGRLQEGEAMVRHLQSTRLAVDEKLSRSKIRLFSGGTSLQGAQELHSEDGSEDEEDDQEVHSDDDEDHEDEEMGSDSEDEQQQQQQGLGRVNGSRGLGEFPVYEAVQQGGRVRRRAMFGSSNNAAAAAFEGASDEEDEQQQLGDREVHSDDDSEDGYEDDLEDADGMGAAAAWKDHIQERVASLFATRGADLAGFIYSTRATSDSQQGFGGGGRQKQQQQDDDQDDEEEEEDDFFTLKVPGGKSAAAAVGGSSSGRQQQQQQQEGPAAVLLQSVDAFDSSRPFAAAAAAVILGSSSSSVPQGPGFSVLDLDARWSSPDAVQGLRNRFVTGDWDATAARAKALPGEESEDDGEAEEGA
jgi:ribosome biogenesis protein BMS1